jgi:hypothetical protein
MPPLISNQIVGFIPEGFRRVCLPVANARGWMGFEQQYVSNQFRPKFVSIIGTEALGDGADESELPRMNCKVL